MINSNPAQHAFEKNSGLNIDSLQNRLINWFTKNKRRLPWRESSHWYKIWISEVMLQQTQVDQVIPYYLRFIQKFANVRHLAAAPEQQVLKAWEGLGYYSRARNLHLAAKIIVEKYDAEIPRDHTELRKLPGFGPYTTHAVLSLAFNQPYAVVDGNVKRVIARLFAIQNDLRDHKTINEIQNIMDSVLPANQPALFNEAMMELGALICRPVKPACTDCPLKLNCKACQLGLTDQLPFKSEKNKIPTRHAVTLIVRHKDRYLLCKRKSTEMLGGLWEFPTREIDPDKSELLFDENDLKRFGGNKLLIKKRWSPVRHAYTHFKLILHPVFCAGVKIPSLTANYSDYLWQSLTDLRNLPLHKGVWKVLERVEKDLIAITD